MGKSSSTWKEVTLGEVCEFKYGKSLPEAKRAGGEIPVYGSNGVVGYHDAALTDGMTIVVGRKGSFGEVNLSKTSCWSIDTTYYIDRTATEADLRWLSYQLVALKLTELNKSAAVPGLNREDAYRKKLLLPPIAEQKRIAAILDKAEELRDLRRKVLGELDAIVQSIFLEMFSDSNGSYTNIKSVRLSEVTTRITDGTHLTPKFINSGVPFIFVKNVKNGSIDFQTDKFISEEEYQKLYERCPVEEGDVIYTTVGATYGQAALVGSFTKFAFQRHIAHLKPDRNKVLARFLETIMQLPVVKRQADQWARGAAQPTVNLKELREFIIPLPTLCLQQEFARRVEAIEQLKTTHRESLNHLDALLASLQHRAFRGEL